MTELLTRTSVSEISNMMLKLRIVQRLFFRKHACSSMHVYMYLHNKTILYGNGDVKYLTLPFSLLTKHSIVP